MKITGSQDVFDLLAAAGPAAALGAALELGLFEALASGPRTPSDLGRELGVGERRCRYWLQLLSSLGLLRAEDGGFALSPAGRAAVLDAHSHETWAFFARTERENLPIYENLVHRLRTPAADWRHQVELPPDYVARMREDPAWTEAFTRMLRELHLPLAEAAAAALENELAGARRLMDLGGGSGVISHALLERAPELEAVIVDIAPVCAMTERIAAEEGLRDRIATHVVEDFTRDPLPGGFDVVLECDLSVHGEELFRKIAGSLEPGGRLILIDQFAPAPGAAPPERVHWRFQSALLDSEYETPTSGMVASWLGRAGFRVRREETLTGPWTLMVNERLES